VNLKPVDTETGGGALRPDSPSPIACEISKVDFRRFEATASRVLEQVLVDWDRFLRRLAHCPATWHPNGFATFIAGDVESSPVRVHVWVPSKDKVLSHPPIHSHDRHVASVVLKGQKEDIRWQTRTATTDASTFEVYGVVRKAIDAELLVPSGQLTGLGLDERRRYGRDEFFSQPAGIFHEIPLPTNSPFVTLCVKSPVLDPQKQLVVDTPGHPTRRVDRRAVSASERRQLLAIIESSVGPS
jgi:hypothetical protein